MNRLAPDAGSPSNPHPRPNVGSLPSQMSPSTLKIPVSTTRIQNHQSRYNVSRRLSQAVVRRVGLGIGQPSFPKTVQSKVKKAAAAMTTAAAVCSRLFRNCCSNWATRPRSWATFLSCSCRVRRSSNTICAASYFQPSPKTPLASLRRIASSVSVAMRDLNFSRRSGSSVIGVCYFDPTGLLPRRFGTRGKEPDVWYLLL